MDRCQTAGERFADDEEMAQIGAGVTRAEQTITERINRREIFLESLILNIDGFVERLFFYYFFLIIEN